MWQRLGLTTIDENLLYQVLSIPTYSGKEVRMQEFLFKYATEHGLQAHIDNKGNIYLQKGSLEKGRFFPCLVAHMDTVHSRQIPFIEANKKIPLQTEVVNGNHLIFAEDFGLGGDDKAGIVIALTIMEMLPVCKAVFFVEEEIGCGGSEVAELSWFRDVGYIIAFDAPGRNCASWSCGGELLFDKTFYEKFLRELGNKHGLTNFEAHPYTDVMMLRMNTCLACMNFSAGYYNHHTSIEYVVAEDMDQAVAMGLHLINRLGNKEYIIPYTPHYLDVDNADFNYFKALFNNHK
jgi:putative aminopeptidase FrvX